jgi:hypothetical protein
MPKPLPNIAAAEKTQDQLDLQALAPVGQNYSERRDPELLKRGGGNAQRFDS